MGAECPRLGQACEQGVCMDESMVHGDIAVGKEVCVEHHSNTSLVLSLPAPLEMALISSNKGRRQM